MSCGYISFMNIHFLENKFILLFNSLIIYECCHKKNGGY